mmetsp:Transcript_4621/g.9739  ORF Transcript_4621/g.9739 Transcript_4621/m.9739 type:complete len:827 (+) Transcript_4621:77-2557(+)|eukprot:CAMPEP_0194305058 /NCGR_PEP_ID=MMETSP0171-20130528/2582_1 /TAXON_ID=218684 /ORGANISM="Corethron pennatum, Strain L29A3" /LENGTH=826 /DNA_ID=CAMNT_0039056473 /DNA_START=49 /DNA_END=2529 /DNA_ORIENTATION=+
MNYLRSFIKSTPASLHSSNLKASGYALKVSADPENADAPSPTPNFPWEQFEGYKLSDPSVLVSVFVWSKTTERDTKLKKNEWNGLARSAMRKCRTLVHPNIVRVHAVLDTDAVPPKDGAASPVLVGEASLVDEGSGFLYIVTEPVTALGTWLGSGWDGAADTDGLGTFGPPCCSEVLGAVSYGFYGVIRALGFLHSTCKSAHGLLSPESVYVTPSSEWKLFHFPLLTPMPVNSSFELYEKSLCPPDYRAPERTESRYHEMQPNKYGVHAMDSFALGVLMNEVYTRPDVDSAMALPQKLVKAVQRMRSSNPPQRPRSQALLKCPVFDNPLVQSQITLDDLAVQSTEEKTHYYQSVPDRMANGSLPMSVAKNKLLPKLLLSLNCVSSATAMGQETVRREVLSVLPPLFLVASSLTEAEYEKNIVPVLPPLFLVADRAIRAALLSNLHVVVPRVEKNAKIINLNIFEPVCSGFTDSSSTLRELTLTSMLCLVPIISPSSMDKLVRYLIRLQGDAEPSIRTNTVIFVGKVAPTLSENMRSKLILPAFTRAMQDTFLPCRLAALKSILSCKGYFDPTSIAVKVLPTVVPHMMDSTSEVRREAFAVTGTLLGILEGVSKEMEEEETREKESVGAEGATAVSDASSYIANISTWAMSSMYKSKEDLSSGVAQVSADPAAPLGGGANAAPSLPSSMTAPPAVAQVKNSDGWDDEDDIDDLDSNVSSPTYAGVGSGATKMKQEDNFFSSFDQGAPSKSFGKTGTVTGGIKPVETVRKAGALAVPSLRTGSKLIVPKSKKMSGGMSIKEKRQAKSMKPQVTKLTTPDVVDDGWDDF